MYLEGKKGVRYKGGRYELIVKVVRGLINEGDLILTLETTASQIANKSYFSFPNHQKEFFYSQGYDKKVWEQTLFSEDSKKLARFVFHKTICPKMFRVRIKAGKRLVREDYNLLDKIVERLFGEFERVNAYGPNEEYKKIKAQPESRLCPCEQLDLFQLD